MNEVSITTNQGISKLVYQGLTLAYLDERQLDSLRAEIFMCQVEMEIAKGRLCSMCGEAGEGMTNMVCRDCEQGCEYTEHRYNEMEEV
jgi:hypothetical protein